ncbi:MAG: hypothetical protein IPG96_15505 [Proteobacteria bacterium]|nr:hypothetical protein [Pseudomonadota bacterium]
MAEARGVRCVLGRPVVAPALVVAVVVFAAAGAWWLAPASLERARPFLHSTSHSTCPDAGDDGNPCDPTCPCSCCPGHAPAVAFLSLRITTQAPSSQPRRVSHADDVQPNDLPFRIFHPPRA